MCRMCPAYYICDDGNAFSARKHEVESELPPGHELGAVQHDVKTTWSEFEALFGGDGQLGDRIHSRDAALC